MEQDEKFMREALREAHLAAEDGEIPIGAVIVWKGRIIGRGHNQTERLHDTTAHAEMLAITAATETMPLRSSRATPESQWDRLSYR